MSKNNALFDLFLSAYALAFSGPFPFFWGPMMYDPAPELNGLYAMLTLFLII